MNEQTFIKTVAPRIGGRNALQQLNPVQLSALIKLLIEKGIITKEELKSKTEQEFELAAKAFMTMPIPSPIRLKPSK